MGKLLREGRFPREVIMAQKRLSKNKKKKIEKLIFWIIGIIIVVIASRYFTEDGVFKGSFGKLSNIEDLGDGKAYFHFLDVGQGDSSLITSGGGAVVIDTGSANQGEKVVDYINRYTEAVDYLILTHPHEDHMGSAAEVLANVEVKNVILPDAASEYAFYTRFLDEAERQDVNVIPAEPGDVYTVGEMVLTVLAPLDVYEDLNNCSIVVRVDVGETAALFTGDAEREVEEALLAQYTAELDCDLFQAGHHGSSTSNSVEFMKAVSPSAAIISCGKDNSYGHPHRETLETFEKFSVDVFRTDDLGDIIFVSDGIGIAKYK